MGKPKVLSSRKWKKTRCAGGRGSQGLRKKLNIEYQQLTIFDVSEENVEAVTSGN